MANGFIRGLDGKLYGIIDGEISEVLKISPKKYELLSDEEKNNGKIYILDKTLEEDEDNG